MKQINLTFDNLKELFGTSPTLQKLYRVCEQRVQTISALVTRAYFKRNREPRLEIVEGLICESSLTVLGGDYNVGKSPLITDLALHIVNGKDWCGRKVQQRPVIVIDFETDSDKFKTDIERECERLRLKLPRVPEMLDPCHWHDGIEEQNKKDLADVSGSWEFAEVFLKRKLKEKPNAVMTIDPLELLFTVDKNAGEKIVGVYKILRRVLAEFPQASILATFNTKKMDTEGRKDPPNLLTDPRSWLDEVSGAKEIMSRSDIRMGIDYLGESDSIRVVNGLRRGQICSPLVIQPAGDPECGFELSPLDTVPAKELFSKTQFSYWEKLPEHFTWDEASKLVPKSSLSRLKEKAQSLGLLREDGNGWLKMKHT